MTFTDLQRFGMLVRAGRERLSLSQERLAELSGMHRTYIGGVERGERNISLLNVIRLARALGVSPASLVERNNPTGPTGPDARASADDAKLGAKS